MFRLRCSECAAWDESVKTLTEAHDLRRNHELQYHGGEPTVRIYELGESIFEQVCRIMKREG